MSSNLAGQITYDPNFTQTAQVLATYRAALKARSLGPSELSAMGSSNAVSREPGVVGVSTGNVGNHGAIIACASEGREKWIKSQAAAWSRDSPKRTD